MQDFSCGHGYLGAFFSTREQPEILYIYHVGENKPRITTVNYVQAPSSLLVWDIPTEEEYPELTPAL